jgi:hypothetical protein
MDQPADDFAASCPRRQVGDRGRGDVVAVRRPQVPGPVRVMPVPLAGARFTAWTQFWVCSKNLETSMKRCSPFPWRFALTDVIAEPDVLWLSPAHGLT